MMDRRGFLGSASGALVSAVAARSSIARAAEAKTQLPFANGGRPLVTYPGKRPMIVLTSRPPQFETPFNVFDESLLTPNDAFFVRYHLADVPLKIDPDAYRLEVKGMVREALSLSLSDLATGFAPIEIVAVNQCSGNSRGFFEPRVAGGQLGNGAMGNARWKGVQLKAVLDRAGVASGARQVVFGGLDGPVMPETPDFAKALDIDHARNGEVMIAYAMNGAELPWLNGYPIRLVVPGYYGTYWVKHLNEITVVDTVFDGFWMKSAYRIPDNDCACTEPGKAASATIPINRYDVRSFLTSLADGAQISAGREVVLRGIAFDGGDTISDVAVSVDDGANWASASLGEDLGRYSFRPWTLPVKFAEGGHAIRVKATNRAGQSQPMMPRWNPAGYMRNVVETTRVVAI